MVPNKRVESDSLRRRFAPPPLAAHAQRWVHNMPNNNSEFANAINEVIGKKLKNVKYHRMYCFDDQPDLTDPELFVGEEIELQFEDEIKIFITWGQGRGWPGDCSLIVSNTSRGLPDIYSNISANKVSFWEKHIGNILNRVIVYGWDNTPSFANLQFETGEILAGTGCEEYDEFGDGLAVLIRNNSLKYMKNASIIWKSSGI